MGERGPLPAENVRRRNAPPPAQGTVLVKRPRMPRDLDADARIAWRRTIPELEQMGILTSADHDALERYCRAWSRYVRAETELAASTYLVPGQNGGLVRNPLLLVLGQIERELNELGKQLNLTPVARLRSRIKHQRPAADGATAATSPGVAKIAEYRERLKAPP